MSHQVLFSAETSHKRKTQNQQKYDVPRIAEGKYLKFAYETLKENNLLETTAAQLSSVICPKCDMKQLCIRQDTAGKLSPFCIDGMLTLCFK